MNDLTTTYVKATDISVGDIIDLGCWNGCRPGEALWKVKRVEVLRHGPQKGGYLFYGSAGSFTDATDLIGYGRPNTTIPVAEVK
jgi:hypothetical protein